MDTEIILNFIETEFSDHLSCYLTPVADQTRLTKCHLLLDVLNGAKIKDLPDFPFPAQGFTKTGRDWDWEME